MQTVYNVHERIVKDKSVVDVDGIVFDENLTFSGVTEQFLENADLYHERYFGRVDFVELMERCLLLSGVDKDSKELKILDIGSGGGSSVFALCKLLPHANIVASDISPNLLRILSKILQENEQFVKRVGICCFDLHDKFFVDESFDVVVGAAILHHLIDPAGALKYIATSLVPGGKLVLVEPLEAGCLQLTIMFEMVLGELQALRQENGPIARLMHAMRADIHARLGVPQVKQITQYLDDKWVFNEPYIRDLSRALGFSSVDVYPASENNDCIYEASFFSYLRESGNAEAEVPPSVLEIVRSFDRGIRSDLKIKMCPTGIIVFRK